MVHATTPDAGAPALSGPAPPAGGTSTRPRPTLWAAIKTLHRLEISRIYTFVLLWGMFVAASKPSDLWSPEALLALFINGLSLYSGFVLNNYSDYPIDRRHEYKGYIADAVERVGRKNTLALYWIEQALTVIAAAAVSVILDNWLFVLVKLAGIVAGMLYNGEPFRMKRRGIWNPIMLAIRFGFVPGMIAYFAVRGTVDAGGYLMLFGAFMLSFSRGLWNAVSDTDEDRAEDIVTPAVQYGPYASMAGAVYSLLPACALLAVGLWWSLGPLYALIGVSGSVGATVYRFLLLRRVDDDRSAITLLRGPVRRPDTQWTILTYVTITLAGLIHLLVVA